ncbi:AbrB/MazE/SpoVT family DNA-binding domain-containing protein [Duganella alba]|nr:AbrB/MazE/SpoVT family DNA-binding domain-containing protein [Duganella alba]
MMKAQLYFDGSSQVIRLPEGMRLEQREFYVRHDQRSGDLILSNRLMSWEEFFQEDARAYVPADFMSADDRAQGMQARDPFADDDI